MDFRWDFESLLDFDLACDLRLDLDFVFALADWDFVVDVRLDLVLLVGWVWEEVLRLDFVLALADWDFVDCLGHIVTGKQY